LGIRKSNGNKNEIDETEQSVHWLTSENYYPATAKEMAKDCAAFNFGFVDTVFQTVWIESSPLAVFFYSSERLA